VLKGKVCDITRRFCYLPPWHCVTVRLANAR